MKLRIMGIDQEITIDDRMSTKLVVADKKLFRRLVSVLSANEDPLDNEVVLLLNNKTLRIKDRVVCVIDYFHYEEWFKLMVSNVYKELEQNVIADISLKENFEQISLSFKSFIDELMLDYDFTIQALKTPKLTSFLKVYVYYLSLENDALTNLYNLIDMISHFHVNDLLLFVNISLFFNEEELERIVKYLLYKKIHFLFVESINNDILNVDCTYYIDDDFCIFNTY